MTEKELRELAKKEGFNAVAVIPTADIVVKPEFRRFCEENRCGKYGANYSCPPDCGTVGEVYNKLLSKSSAMVLQMVYDIKGYDDKENIQKARSSFNYAVLNVMDKIREKGYNGFPLGYNGCPLCSPCKRTLNQPCAFPEDKISCISAYCIDVAELANSCEFEFLWSQDKLYLFGMVLFDNK